MDELIFSAERRSSCRDGPKLEMFNFIPPVRFGIPTKTDMYFVSTARFADSEFDETAVRVTAGRQDASCVNVANG